MSANPPTNYVCILCERIHEPGPTCPAASELAPAAGSAEVDVCIGPTTSGRVVIELSGGVRKVMEIQEAEKMMEILSDSIRVAKTNPPNDEVSHAG